MNAWKYAEPINVVCTMSSELVCYPLYLEKNHVVGAGVC